MPWALLFRAVFGGVFLLTAVHAGAASPAQASAPSQFPRLNGMDVPGGDAGISIHVLRVTAPNPSRKPPILLLHPYGAPSAEAYDLPGFPLMRELAADGREVFAMDARGFGRSSKPAAPVPVGRAAEAVRDVVAVIGFIRSTTGASQVDLFGWSWGGVVAPMVAIERPDLVRRLALLGAMGGFQLPMMTQPFAAKDDPTRFGPKSVAYQKAETAKVLGHWRMMLGNRMDLVEPATLAAVEALAERASAGAPGAAPGFTLRPMGPLQDLFEIWSNRPIYAAERVKVPTLVIRGDRDSFADQALARRIPRAQEVVVSEATHWLPYERNRGAFVSALREFFGGG